MSVLGPRSCTHLRRMCLALPGARHNAKRPLGTSFAQCNGKPLLIVQ